MSLISFILFCFFASITPGPANLAIFSVSGSQTLAKSMLFIAGICCGFLAVLLISILPVASVLFLQEDYVYLQMTLQWLSASYLIYLSYNIFKHQGSEELNKVGFFYGIIIHPLSPKAWFFVITSYTTFISTDQANEISYHIYVMIFLVSAMISHLIWYFSGVSIKKKMPRIYTTLLNKAISLILIAIVLFSLLIDIIK